MAWTPWLRRAVGVAGSLSLALGLLVITGWHLKSYPLLQVLPGFAIMQYNTALGFAAEGAGMILLAVGWPRITGVLGSAAGALGFLSLFEQFGGWNLGVDQFFHHPFTTLNTESPGRMAASTAVCFSLIGLSLAWLGFSKGFKGRAVVLSMAASVVMVLSLMSIFGYLTGTRELLAWGSVATRHEGVRELLAGGRVSYMALHSAAGMILLSFTVFIIAWRDGRAAYSSLPEWLAIPVACAGLSLTLIVWQAMRVRDRLQVERIVQGQAQLLSNTLRKDMDDRVNALQRMAARIERQPDMTEATWASDAGLYVAHYSGYQAVERVDRNLVVRWVVPLRGNEQVPALDIKLNAKRQATFEEARLLGQPILTTPVSLAQGGLGNLICIPIAAGKDSPGGFVVGVFRPQALLGGLVEYSVPGNYSVFIWQDGQVIFSHPGQGGQADASWVQEVKLPMFGRSWVIRIAPTDNLLGQLVSSIPAFMLAGGGLLSLLLGLAVFLAQNAARDRARILAASVELERVLATQRAIFDSAHVAIIATDLQGTIQHFNAGAEDILGYKASEMVGNQSLLLFHDSEEVAERAESLSMQLGLPVELGFETFIALARLGRTDEREWTYIRKDGRRVPVQLSVTAVRNPVGELTGYVGVGQDLTQRIQIEQTLLEREARFRALIENGSDIITISNAGGVITYVSPSVLKILGYEPRDMVGRPITKFLPSVLGPAARLDYRSLVASPPGTLQSFSFQLVAQDGTARTMDVIAHNQLQTPLIEGIVSVVRDVTERIQAEEALGRERDFTDTILETVGALVVVTDWEGRIARFNRACEVVTGYPAVEILGRQFWDVFIPESTRESTAGEFLSRKAGDYPRSSTSTWVTKTGEERFFEWSDTVLLGEDGQPEFIIGTGIDITERTQAAEALRLSEERMHAVIEHAPMILFSFDLNGVFTMAQGRGLEVLELRSELVVGQNVDRWQQVLPGLRTDVARALGGETFTNVLGVAKVAFENWYAPMRDAGGAITGAIGVAVDITEKRRVEQLKNEFVATVSHELRTPLTSIRGSLGLLAGGVAGPMAEPAVNLLNIALRNSERLGRLVNDILDMEKIESGKMDFTFKAVDLRGLLEQSVEANRAFGEAHGVTFELGALPPGARLWADEDRLMQVLANLLSNAAKYSAKGECVQVGAERRNAFIRIAVRDHGPGIPQAFRGRIFERFAQADASDTRLKGGTGLGLAVSRAIVEGHHGSMDFADAAGGGAEFYFEIPESNGQRLGP